MPVPEASVVTSKMMVKSGKAKTGRLDMAFLRVSKAVCADGFHYNFVCWSRLVRADAM